MNEKLKQVIEELVDAIQPDAAGKRDVKDALEHAFEMAGFHLEIGDGFAYAEEV
jgi:hypothetical protein